VVIPLLSVTHGQCDAIIIIIIIIIFVY